MREVQVSNSQNRKVKMPKSEPDKLLETILKYIVPKLKKKFVNKKQGKLEELLEQEKPKLKSFQLFLDDLLKSPNKTKKPIKKLEIIEFLESKRNDEIENNEEIKYAAVFEKKKEEKSNLCYSVEIKYEESETEEKLSVKVKYSIDDPLNQKPLDNYSINKKTIKENIEKNNPTEYSISIKKEKENKTQDNYSISLVYENNYEEERLSINYKSTIGAYLNRRQEALHNFEDRVPGKHVDVLPASVMGGILGFTYLGQDRMTLRDDLIGETKKMVDIHESIHTPDEYETRILTDWIMEKPRPKYIK